MSELKSSQWVEYPNILGRYSNNDQLQAKQYSDILKTEKGQHFFKTEFDSLEEFSMGLGNPNLPRYNSHFKVKVKNDKGEIIEVDAYKPFWQFKQDAGRNFTSYKSAGLSNIDTDVSIAQMPLEGTNKSDPALVLSNNNYVRQNLQRYGKEYLTTTNLLNSIAWNNGMFNNHATSVSPIRENINDNYENMMHQNAMDRNTGDEFARPMHPLRVDLPSNLMNISYDSFQYINVSFIIPNQNTNKLFSERLKTGTLDLDSMKNVGRSCLTREFNFTPLNKETPVEVINDNDVFDPISNVSNNLYCSVNTNFVTMPKNYSPTMSGLDTSFVVNPGMNSVSIGTVMSPNLQSLINYQLYNLNKSQIERGLRNQLASSSQEYKNLLNNKTKLVNSVNNAMQDLNLFINNLSIFKFGPGKVICKELSNDRIDLQNEVFLLLPSMLSENVFAVRPNIPSTFASEEQIPNLHTDNCLNKDASSFENALNCGFRGTSGQWLQKENPNFVPNVFNNPNDYNNDLNNLKNGACGVNPYMAECSF